jgi:hypothetical protein
MAWKDHALRLISYSVRRTLIVLLHVRFSHRCCQLVASAWMLRCVVGKMFTDVDRGLLTWIAVLSFSGLSSPRKLLDPKYALFTQRHSVTSEKTCISISYKSLAAIPSTTHTVLSAVCPLISMWSGYYNRYICLYDVRIQEHGNGVSRLLKLEDFKKRRLRILILVKIWVGEGGRFAWRPTSIPARMSSVT